MIHFQRFLSGARQSLPVLSANCGRLLVTLSVLVSLALPASLMAQDTGKTDQWQFMIEPYFWATGIDGSTANGADFTIHFDDLLNDLEFAFMGVVGVKKGKWSFMVDTFYADIKDTKDSSITELNSTVNFQTEVEVKTWIVTPVIGFNLIDCERGKLDVVAGVRYLDVEIDVHVNSDRARARNPEFSGSNDFWDGIVGLKSEITLYEQLYMPLYLDIGTGESDFTWQVAAGLGYRFSACDVIAGYRYLSWEFDDSSSVNDMNLSGPYLGVKFVF